MKEGGKRRTLAVIWKGFLAVGYEYIRAFSGGFIVFSSLFSVCCSARYSFIFLKTG